LETFHIQTMSTFILLGGSEMRPTSWAACQAALETAGHQTIALDWADTPWQNGPETALAHLEQPLQRVKDAVLVGHSAAGLFLPSLAERIQARAEIHLASLVARSGESFLDRVFASEEIFTPKWEAAYREILAAKDAPEKLRTTIEPFLFHDCPPDSFAHWRSSSALDLLYGLLFTSSGDSSRQRHYIVCRDDRTIRPEWQRQAAAKIQKSDPIEFPSGHCPHLAKPRELAELLIKLSARRD
jgi:pimeloyl-ACP methyl ester carboxylesterase